MMIVMTYPIHAIDEFGNFLGLHCCLSDLLPVKSPIDGCEVYSSSRKLRATDR